MERISRTPQTNNNYYTPKKQTIKGVSRDVVKFSDFQKMLDAECSKLNKSNNHGTNSLSNKYQTTEYLRNPYSAEEQSKLDKFKSLVTSAEAKLAGKVSTAPLKDDFEVNKMMSECVGIKSKVQRTSIEDISKPSHQKNLASDEYVSPVSYKNNSSSRGYKQNFGYTKTSFSNYKRKDTLENDNYLPQVLEKKESFWSRFKKAIKNFFNPEPVEEMNSKQPHQIVEPNFKEGIKVSYVANSKSKAPQISYKYADPQWVKDQTRSIARQTESKPIVR